MLLLLVVGCLVFYFAVYSREHGGSVALKEDFTGKRRPTSYILWNGDYASSFRVLQALYDEGRIVVPVYLERKVTTPMEQRRQHTERRDMHRITSEISQSGNAGDAGGELKPLMVIPLEEDGKTVNDYVPGVASDMGHPLEWAVSSERPHPGVRFPCIGMTQSHMLEKARAGGYDGFLSSCRP